MLKLPRKLELAALALWLVCRSDADSPSPQPSITVMVVGMRAKQWEGGPSERGEVRGKGGRLRTLSRQRRNGDPLLSLGCCQRKHRGWRVCSEEDTQHGPPKPLRPPVTGGS